MGAISKIFLKGILATHSNNFRVDLGLPIFSLFSLNQQDENHKSIRINIKYSHGTIVWYWLHSFWGSMRFIFNMKFVTKFSLQDGFSI